MYSLPDPSLFILLRYGVISMPRSNRLSKTFLMFVSPLFFAANCKDPCKKPFMDSEKCADLDTDTIIDIAEPTIELRLLDFQPEIVEPGVSFEASLAGKGFEEGAMIRIGDKTLATEFVSSTEIMIAVAPLDAGTYNVTVTNPSENSHTLYDALQVGALETEPTEMCEDITVYFDLNKDRLTSESEQSLLDQSGCWMRTGAALVVAGHCDERGTTEYNITLGQRRAGSVERYLLTQGVSSSNIRTVSHGEEQPAVNGSSEKVYQQNRRAEITVSN